MLGDWCAQTGLGQIKSLAALNEKLSACTHAAQVTLTDEEQQHIVRYLNDQFYKLK